MFVVDWDADSPRLRQNLTEVLPEAPMYRSYTTACPPWTLTGMM